MTPTIFYLLLTTFIVAINTVGKIKAVVDYKVEVEELLVNPTSSSLNFELLLKIENLSRFSVKINSANAVLYIDGKMLASLTSCWQGAAIVKANGATSLRLCGGISYSGLGNTLLQLLLNSSGVINANVVGNIMIHGIKIPIDFNLPVKSVKHGN